MRLDPIGAGIQTRVMHFSGIGDPARAMEFWFSGKPIPSFTLPATPNPGGIISCLGATYENCLAEYSSGNNACDVDLSVSIFRPVSMKY